MVKIIEYNNKYLGDIKDLLTELEEHIVSIDKDNLDIIHPEYHEKNGISRFRRSKEQTWKMLCGSGKQ